MTPARVGIVLLTLVLAALLAVGVWGERPTPRLSDDDHIAIALSDPQVFHPTGPASGQKIVAVGVERSGSTVAVTVISDGIRFRVYIDPRTGKITQVVRQ